MKYQFTEICFVVRDYKKTIEHWVKTTGAGPFYLVRSDMIRDPIYRGKPAEDTYVSALGFLGSTLMEFVQPLNSAPSIYQEILQTRGDQAFHHIYPRFRPLTADEYDSKYEAYRSAGYEPVLELQVNGIGRNTFFDATKDFGCFFELLEINPPAYAMVEQMHREHLEWDGKQPIREFADLAA